MMKDIDKIDLLLAIVEDSIEYVQEQADGKASVDHLISLGDPAITLCEGLMAHSRFYAYAASEFLRLAAPEKWDKCDKELLAKIYYLRFFHDPMTESWIQFSTVEEDYILGSAGKRLVKLGRPALKHLKRGLDVDKLLTDCVGNSHAGIRRKDLVAAFALIVLGRKTKALTGDTGLRDEVITKLIEELKD